MRFDASRVESLVRELGDPRYAGPDGEANVADLIAGRFAAMGLDVERREVTGSRFPQRVAPWVGWLGYGVLITSVYGLAPPHNIFLSILAFVLSLCCASWINAVDRNRIRPGRERPPLETAPVLMASRPGGTPVSVRVVLQAVISGVRPDPFHFAVVGPIRGLVVYALLYLFPPFWGMAFLLSRAGFWLHPRRLELLRISEVLTRYVYPPFLLAAWIGILVLLSREYRHRRGTGRRERPDRRGLALLLETARTWPRTGSRPIEPIFAAAGGHSLDYAGSREVVRLLGSEWSPPPTLLILLFAPGAGEELWLSTNAPSLWGLDELAEEAARSLWIPHRLYPELLESLWPLDDCHPAVALIGSDPRAFDAETVDPQAVHRAAQLATEVALRWARRQRETVSAPRTSG